MRKLLAVVIAVALLATAARAQDLEVELQRAIQQETVTGNLKTAIASYRSIADRAGKNRGLAARALLRLADAHRKLGDAEARRIYEQVVRNYADQADQAKVARAALAALAPDAKRPTGQATREVWSGMGVDPMGAPSADGALLSFTDWNSGDLGVRDLATGAARRLTNTGGWEKSGDFAEFSVPSPDGRDVAYAWFTDAAPITAAYDLRVISTANGTARPRVVYRGDDLRWVAPCAWSPDGTALVIMRERSQHPVEIAVLTLGNGAVRPLKTLVTAAQRVSLSPDGRYVAYDMPVAGNVGLRDVHVIGIDGQGDTPVASTTANEQLPLWSADGSQLLFISNRTGNQALWSAPMRDGKPAGDHRLVKPDAASMYPLGVTRSGGLYYFQGGDRHNVYTTTLGASGETAGRPVLVTDQFLNSNTSGAWSPDGRRIAYYSFRGLRENQGAILVVRDAATGREREYPVSMPVMKNNTAIRWFGDGHAVLVTTREAIGSAYRRIDLTTGAETLLAKIEGRGPGVTSPALSADGKTIYYPDADEKGVSRSAVRLDVASGRRTVVVPGWILSVALSPDGSRLAYVGTRERANSRTTEIGIVPEGGGDPQVVYRAVWTDSSRFATLAWTPDGRDILFVRTDETSGNQELWRVAAAGGEPRKTGVAAPGMLKQPSVHPDGRRLLYSVREWGNSAIWVLENFLPKSGN